MATHMSKCLDSVSPTATPITTSTECLMVPAPWRLHSTGMKTVVYRLLSDGIPDDCPPMYITHVLFFTDGWQLWVHRKLLAPPSSFLPSCGSSTLAQLLADVEACHMCEGVPDPSLLAVVDVKIHIAFLDEIPNLNRDGVVYMQTCRDANCELLISGQLIQCHQLSSTYQQLASALTGFLGLQLNSYNGPLKYQVFIILQPSFLHLILVN